MKIDKESVRLICNPKGMFWYKEYLEAKNRELDAEIARLKEELKENQNTDEIYNSKYNKKNEIH